jgi:anti-sigma regulatory factor (Ser/Thr protein kinase)
MHFDYQIEGGDFSTAGTISSNVKKFLKQLNVDGSIIKRTVVALYEAEVNVVAHAYRGKVEVDYFENKIQIRIIDEGPGISDIEKAMQAGFSTASPEVREMGFGAGMGLPNMKNNTDELIVNSEVGVGTTVMMVNYFNNQ